jgi:hypothetical protein
MRCEICEPECKLQKRILIIVFFLGLFAAIGGAIWQTSPGYMDAYYYYSGGVSLAQGEGFSEQFLWNYLDDPEGLPHAAFSYWMPLTSFVAAGGIKLFSGLAGLFRGAQLSFILIAACIPPLTAGLAWQLTGEKKFAWFAGLLAVFMGYYQPFIAAVDAFGIYMLLGGLFFLIAAREWRSKYLLLGLLAGLMHLARADGLLWLGMAGLAVLVDQMHENPSRFWKLVFSKKVVVNGVTAIGGYLLILGPWMVRNYLAFGSPLAPGGSRTIWVLDYDELFAYPAEMLTFSRWWAAGLGELIKMRYDALIVNLQSSAASLGMLFPGVLAVLGFFRMRRSKPVQLGVLYWIVLIVVMSAVFPFAGMRGGFFHSGAALMPLIWVMVPVGVEALTDWSVKTFKWQSRKIKPFYIGLVFVYVVLFSFGITVNNVIGTDSKRAPVWNETERQYLAVEAALNDFAADPDAVIVCATPPAYYVINGRSAIAMPDGGLEPLVEVIERYQVGYVLVEENHPDELEVLYYHPEDIDGLKYLTTVEGVHIFSWEGE